MDSEGPETYDKNFEESEENEVIRAPIDSWATSVVKCNKLVKLFSGMINLFATILICFKDENENS